MIKYDQLAIVAANVDEQERLTRHGTWVEDFVTTTSLDFWGALKTNRARLKFNYDLWPMEYEVLTYLEGWNWLEFFGVKAGVSHFGMHVPYNGELLKDFTGRYDIVQKSVTVEHTNPAIRYLRRYRYTIFDARNELGTFLKTIERMSLEEGAVAEAALRAEAR